MVYLPSTINNTVVTHSSPEHFTATYTSNVTITCSNAPFTIDDTVCTVVSILYKPTWWTRQSILKNGENWVSMVASSNVITVVWAWTPFASGDTYEIWVNYIPNSNDITTDTQKTTNQNPTPSYYQTIDGWDGTNLAAATNYYPSSLWMSMDQYKWYSCSGKMIDADGTMTLYVEGTDDEDQTNADWKRFMVYDINSWTFTDYFQVVNWTLVFSFNIPDCNFQYVRVVMINSGATNTFILKMRQIY